MKTTTETQTVKIGRIEYTVTTTGLGYVLKGPRGGELLGVRNVRSGLIYVMQGTRTVATLNDQHGFLEVVA